ncbi:MAG: hypothetical protein LC676_10845 [Loktanella sp.]|nr:hypothetical protein [Loktanella sp.]
MTAYILRMTTGARFAPKPGAGSWTKEPRRRAHRFDSLEAAEKARAGWNAYFAAKGFEPRCDVEPVA